VVGDRSIFLTLGFIIEIGIPYFSISIGIAETYFGLSISWIIFSDVSISLLSAIIWPVTPTEFASELFGVLSPIKVLMKSLS